MKAKTKAEEISNLIKAFGTTTGEHSLHLKGYGTAYLALNWKGRICPEIEWGSLDELYDKVSRICQEEGVDIEYGKYRVRYSFKNDEEIDPYDDGTMEDEVECYAFQIEEELFNLHEENEMIKYELDIHVMEVTTARTEESTEGALTDADLEDLETELKKDRQIPCVIRNRILDMYADGKSPGAIETYMDYEGMPKKMIETTMATIEKRRTQT